MQLKKHLGYAFLLAILLFLSSVTSAKAGPTTNDSLPNPVIKKVVLTSNSSVDINLLTKEELYNKIDSLLETNQIPTEVLQAYSRRIQELSSLLTKNEVDTNKQLLPAEYFGESINNGLIYPYDKNILLFDSVIHLELINTLENRAYCHPITGMPVTSEFGYRWGRNHNGIDLDLFVWDSVHAAFDGVVRLSNQIDEHYGRFVVITHFNGLETLYAHLHRFKVNIGDTIKAGEVIGLGGSSGRSTGSHLHFETRFRGIAINPRYLINFEKEQLISDSLTLKVVDGDLVAIPKGLIFHTVRSGDYLIKISKKYGVSVNSICTLNGLKSNSTLRVGQKIKVLESN